MCFRCGFRAWCVQWAFMVAHGLLGWTGATMESQNQSGKANATDDSAARAAAVLCGIDYLLEQVAQLRAIRLHQLAAARSARLVP